ncbi:MAG: polysaccharide deacetylase family protein [Eubacterium sp.]|nr:polysaccharide deacetylase family protein [Eubacterium sp.]
MTKKIWAMLVMVCLALSFNGGQKAEAKMVILEGEKGEFAYPEATMYRGEKLKLQFTDKRNVTKYHWSSSDPKVAKVGKKGVVTAKKKGSAVITGRKGDEEVTCDLTVKKRKKSVIYLTFDDGPSSSSTPKILKILKKCKVKATFFELKPAKKDFRLTKRIIKEGHSLALHGYQHNYRAIYRSEQAYKENIEKLQKLFYKKFKVWPTATRFPGGSSNTVSRFNRGIMSRLSKKMGDWGYTYFDWNVSSSDAGGARNSRQVFRSVKSGLQKNRENVVLMHDFPNNNKTIGALKKIIRYGKKHGYSFQTISASTKPVHHGINN